MKKRLISGIAAVALCTSLFTATAYAEASDSEKLSLISVPISDFCPEGTDALVYIGKDYYANYNTNSYFSENLSNNNFLLITEEDREHLRETGEFRYKKVDNGFDDEEITLYSGVMMGYDYSIVEKDDKSYLLKITDDPAVWKTVREYDDPHLSHDHAKWVNGEKWNYAGSSGIFFEIENKDNGIWVRKLNEDGSSVDTFFEGEIVDFWGPVNKNYAYTAWVEKNTEKTENGAVRDIEEYLVDDRGNAEKVFEISGVTEHKSINTPWLFVNQHYIQGETWVNRVYHSINSSDDDVPLLTVGSDDIDIGSSFPEYEGWKLYQIGFIDGDRAMGQFIKDIKAEEIESCCVLLDISDPDNIKVVSDKPYEQVSKPFNYDPCDIFLVSNGEKWGYIDRNGQELGWFDDAGDFGTEYAPVIQDGKMFLINKDMEPVSEAIEADGCCLANDDLFEIHKGNESYLVTFTEPQEGSDEPDTAPDVSETDIPKTGSNNITLTAVLLSAGAVAFAASKKHK